VTTMRNEAIFRKVALQRLSSPEQLDQLLRVTDAKGWTVLVAVGVVLATALLWGIMGRVPQSVRGSGILIRSGGVFEVTPLESGRITDMAVRVGEVVEEGQVVARMAQPELSERREALKATLADLRSRHRELLDHGSRDVALQTAYLAQERATIEQSLAAARKSLVWHAEKETIQEKLVQQGLLTKQTLLNTRQQYEAAQSRISAGQSELAQIAVKELDLRNRRQSEARESELRIAERAREAAELDRELKAKTEIVALHTGRILEIMSEHGALVSRGEPICTLDLTGRSVKDLEAVLYVSSVEGKQVRVGMPILIAPSTVKQEEHGLLVGTVTYVSDFPATSRGMLKVLKNEKLVASLAGSDAPYEVRADLTPDPGTVSRYRWTSAGGPAVRVQSGTLAVGHITIASRRPLELVLPMLRRAGQ
jgi:HlyD family secretion protein